MCWGWFQGPAGDGEVRQEQGKKGGIGEKIALVTDIEIAHTDEEMERAEEKASDKLAHGIDNRPVVSEWRRKSVSVENTYDQDLPDLASCLQNLPALLESLQPRLQRLDADYRIHNCFLKMKFFDFSQTTIERQQTSPNLDDYGMLCDEAWQRGAKPVRLLGLGVRLIDLTDASGQMDLFEE